MRLRRVLIESFVVWYVSPTLSTVDGTIGWLESQGRRRVPRARPPPRRYIHPLGPNKMPSRKSPEPEVVHRPPSRTFVVGTENSKRGEASGPGGSRSAPGPGGIRCPRPRRPPALRSNPEQLRYPEIVSVNIDAVKRLRVRCQKVSETVRVFACGQIASRQEVTVVSSGPVHSRRVGEPRARCAIDAARLTFAGDRPYTGIPLP